MASTSVMSGSYQDTQTHHDAARPPSSSASSSRHSKASKPRSSNAVRQRPADPLIMSSMIDSLAAHAPLNTADKRKYYQKVDIPEHPRGQSASFGAWFTEGSPPSPPLRSSSRFANRSPTPSVDDFGAATPPAISKNLRHQYRLGSYDSGYQESTPPSSPGAQVLRSSPRLGGTRARTPNTRELAAFGPSRFTGLKVSTHSRRDSDLSASTAQDGTTPASETSYQDSVSTDQQRKLGRDSPIASDSYFNIRRTHSPTTYASSPSDLQESARPAAGSSGKGKEKEYHAITLPSPRDSRTSPADMVPNRRSSLRHTDKRPSRMSERRTAQKNSSTDAVNVRPKSTTPTRDDALTEEVFTALGDEDETVKRIRQLKEQKLLRMQSLRAEQHDQEETDINRTPRPIPKPIRIRADPLSSTTSPVPTPTSGRAPDTTKANKILGLDVGKPAPVVNAAARLVGPFDPFQENPLNKSTDSPDSSRESSPTRPSNDYARVMRAIDAETRTSTTIARAEEPSEPTLRNDSGIQASTGSGKPSKITKRSISTARRTSVNDKTNNISDVDQSSVDNEVNSFMTNPRLSQVVRHPKTARAICFSEVGDPKGFPVFVCVGMGLTRYVSAFYDDLASSLGLRLITPDRPGSGRSDPRTNRDPEGPMSWHQDVAAICSDLGIAEFSLLAHSAGAIYALATALVIPSQVTGRIHLLAPWIPPSQFETTSSLTTPSDADLSDPTTGPVGSLPRSQRLLRVLPVALLKAANSNFLGLSGTSPPNRDRRGSTSSTTAPRTRALAESTLLSDADPDFPLPSSPPPAAPATPLSSALVQPIWSAATRDANPAADLLVCLERNRPVGFRYEDVRAPLVVVHGTEDSRVPLDNVKWLVARVNGVRRARRQARNNNVPPPVPRKTSRDPPSPLDPRSHWKGGGVDPLAVTDEVVDGEDEIDADAELRLCAGEGHGLMASAPVMAAVLADIAADWRSRKGMRR